MAPVLCRAMSRDKPWESNICEKKLISKTRFISCIDVIWNREPEGTPALLTSTSIRFFSETMALMPALICSPSSRSKYTGLMATRVSSARREASSENSSVSLRTQAKMSAPLRANTSIVALPMPRLQPVMTAVLFFKSMLLWIIRPMKPVTRCDISCPARTPAPEAKGRLPGRRGPVERAACGRARVPS